MHLSVDLIFLVSCCLGLIAYITAEDDYYKVLGIERSATQRDIKKAFRKLAVKYHPDKNKDDPSAEQKFMEISKAYDTLSDKEKRRQYDRYGDSAAGGTAHEANFQDSFRSNSFFNDRGSRHFPRGSAFSSDSAFDGFDFPSFNFDSFHQRHHQNFHRNTQFHQQHQNMHRAAHNAARQQNTFHQQSSSAHQRSGVQCHTTTTRHGNTVTTRTVCS